MPPIQPATNYDINHPEAVAGAIVDGQLANSITGLAVADLPFGRLVVRAAGPVEAVGLPAATGDITNFSRGIVQRVQDDVADANDVLVARSGKDATLCDFGEIWVEVEDAVTVGAQAFARHTGGNEGMFRSDVAAGSATLVPNAVFMTAAAAAGLAKVRIRLVG